MSAPVNNASGATRKTLARQHLIPRSSNPRNRYLAVSGQAYPFVLYRRKADRKGRLPSLSRLSSADLQRELRRRQRGVRGLERKRAALAAKIDDLDARVGGNGHSRGSGVGGIRGGRARNGTTLAEALAKTLSGKTLSVSEAAEAVRKAGYRTSSRTFRTQVNITLIKSGMFKRLGHGQYTAK